MALIKSTTLPSGVTGEYWRLTAFSVVKKGESSTGMAKLELFKDSSHATGYPIPNTTLCFSFTFTPQELIGNVPALLYQRIKDKNHPTLTGATDG